MTLLLFCLKHETLDSFFVTGILSELIICFCHLLKMALPLCMISTSPASQAVR